MVKHKRGRRRGNRTTGTTKFQVLTVDQIISMGTLIADGILASSITALGVAKFTVVAVDLLWSMDDITAGEGPIQVGIANGNLTGAEIGEYLDANPSSQNDIIALERLRRPVRATALFAGFETHETLNDGKAIRTKLRTTLDEGVEMAAWARNKSGATLTAGAVVRVMGKIYGFWS